MERRYLPFLVVVALLAGNVATGLAQQQNQSIEFNRDVRPILSDRCFLCHGPDQTGPAAGETDLRLDLRDSAVNAGVFDFESPADSELLRRVRSEDADERMPPPDAHRKTLTEQEVKLLERWIEQGANYQSHWAYIPPVRPEVPSVPKNLQAANPIDAFVMAKLVEQKMRPASLADRATLIRRVTLDLTGLPPTVEEVDAYINDPADELGAYEKVVDRLLQSPKYGEQMARRWLDAARYADTSGYQYDFEREQWVWRDWVIHAFNQNMPFDQFTIHQIAGDLLPNATPQTRLATGFNRNHPITIEGGVVDEEYRTEYVIDRVVTTSTVFLGQTMLCARCHDHKYDPISQRDFYRFFAFFNNVPERGLNGFAPKEKIASPLATDRLEAVRRQLQQAEQALLELKLPVNDWTEQLRQRSPKWSVQRPINVSATSAANHEVLDDGSVLFSGNNPANDDYTLVFAKSTKPVRVIRLEALVDETFGGKAGRSNNGNFVLSEFVVEYRGPGTGGKDQAFQKANIVEAEADFQQPGFPIQQSIDGQKNRKGWAVEGHVRTEKRVAHFRLDRPIPEGSEVRITMAHRYGMQHQIGRPKISFSPQSGVPQKMNAILAVASNQRDRAQKLQLLGYLVDEYGGEEAKRQWQTVQRARSDFASTSSFPETMIMREQSTPRKAYVLERGEYDKPRKDEALSPGLPEALGDLGDLPTNRLGLAKWLVSPQQPLTSRVTVNRFWQDLFGTGLVETSEDFGSQGAFPTHPELIDWLACEFVDSGWDVKHLIKTILLSHTYRQQSTVTKQQLAVDPTNRWLARGPRFRLDGESIRDSVLAVAGLLDPKLGGPSVYPYHPQGLWMEINNRPNFSRSYPHTEDPAQLYRRSLYTFWKRAVPPPSMATFDAPSREYCVVRRSKTNTPLQAFVMLHDPQFLEAAAHLARQTSAVQEESFAERLEFMFRRCLSRRPSPAEVKLLAEEFDHFRKLYRTDAQAIRTLVESCNFGSAKENTDPETAAWIQVARMILNLSEFITKE